MEISDISLSEKPQFQLENLGIPQSNNFGNEQLGNIGKEKIESLKKEIQEINELIENRTVLSKQVIREAEKIKREITNFLLENRIKDPNDPVETQERSALRQKKVDISQLQLDEQISCWKDCALLKKELREKQRELDEKQDRINMFSKILEE
jgi:hypothetical protein